MDIDQADNRHLDAARAAQRTATPYNGSLILVSGMDPRDVHCKTEAGKEQRGASPNPGMTELDRASLSEGRD